MSNAGLKGKQKQKSAGRVNYPCYYDDDYLKPVRNRIKKLTFASMDTEDNSKGKLFFIVQYDGKKYYHFFKPYNYVSFLKRLSNKYGKENIYIPCVNLEYDVINAFKGFYDFLEFNYGGRLIFVKLRETKITGMDILNHYKASVKKMGKILGIKKIAYNFGRRVKGTKLLLKRCEVDCKITYKFIEYYQQVLNELGCQLKMTIASTAKDLFCRKFLKAPIRKIKDKYLNLMRNAYSGGRTEILKMYAKRILKLKKVLVTMYKPTGEIVIIKKKNGRLKIFDRTGKIQLSGKKYVNKRGRVEKYVYSRSNIIRKRIRLVPKKNSREHIHYVDVNSLYPYVMKNFDYPDTNTMFMSKGMKALKYPGVSQADITVKETEIPYLPFKHDGKLLFPVGRLKGWWSNYELNYALKHKLIKVHSIKKSVCFKKSLDIFSEFVNYLYDLRRKYKGDKSTKGRFFDITLKLLMNSLYGKFGERVENIDLVFDKATGKLIDTELTEAYYPEHTNFIWALYTTAYARTVLYEGLMRVHNAGGTVLYCDTDSILYQGKPNLVPVSSELGEFSGEGVFKEAIFIQPKNYLLYDLKGKPKIACKGVPKEKSLRYILNVIHNITAPVRYKKPTKFRQSIHAIEPGYDIPNVWLYRTKIMKSDYTKRTIINKGGDTVPLKIVYKKGEPVITNVEKLVA